MDQIQREKIAAKLKKIKALAERGVGGEKETAMRMYEDLKARYELEDEEIMLDAVTLHWFGYATELEEELLTQIFYKVTGGTTYHIYTGKYSRRKKRGCDCTEIEAAEITLLFNFYKAELKRELEAMRKWVDAEAKLGFTWKQKTSLQELWDQCFDIDDVTETDTPEQAGGDAGCQQ